MATQRLVGPGSPLALTQPRGGGCGGAVPPLPRGWKRSISPQNSTQHSRVLLFPVPGVAPGSSDGVPVAEHWRSRHSCGCELFYGQGCRETSLGLCQRWGMWHTGAQAATAQGARDRLVHVHTLVSTLAPHPGGHGVTKEIGTEPGLAIKGTWLAMAPPQTMCPLQGTWCPEASRRGTRLAQPGPCARCRSRSLGQADAPSCSSPGLGSARGVQRGPQG